MRVSTDTIYFTGHGTFLLTPTLPEPQPLALDPHTVLDILITSDIPADASLYRVARVAPWCSAMICTECGHRTTADLCARTPDGYGCPGCHEPGAMIALRDRLHHIEDLDVFETDRERGLWAWAVAGQYPTFGFRSAAEAREDALATLHFAEGTR